VPEKMLRLVFHRLAAIGLWLRALRRRVFQFHLLDGLFGAKQWLFSAYFPIAGLFLWVSYPYYRHNTIRLFKFSKSNNTNVSGNKNTEVCVNFFVNRPSPAAIRPSLQKFSPLEMPTLSRHQQYVLYQILQGQPPSKLPDESSFSNSLVPAKSPKLRFSEG